MYCAFYVLCNVLYSHLLLLEPYSELFYLSYFLHIFVRRRHFSISLFSYTKHFFVVLSFETHLGSLSEVPTAFGSLLCWIYFWSTYQPFDLSCPHFSLIPSFQSLYLLLMCLDSFFDIVSSYIFIHTFAYFPKTLGMYWSTIPVPAQSRIPNSKGPGLSSTAVLCYSRNVCCFV